MKQVQVTKEKAMLEVVVGVVEGVVEEVVEGVVEEVVEEVMAIAGVENKIVDKT
jgi:hypothetical protein